MPKAPGTPADLINNDPIPSGCNHRGTGFTRTPIDNGYVDTCDFCRTDVVVHEHDNPATCTSC